MRTKLSFFSILLLVLAMSGCYAKHRTSDAYCAKEKAMELTVGSPAPDFTLLDENATPHTLSAQRGSKIALYFYPKDNTPGCTAQACSIRDGFELLKQAGITIWGVSYDSPESHKKFQQKYHLPFMLLSDSNKNVARAYGVKGFLFVKRHTFLINEEGVIVNILKDVDVKNHAQEIIDAFNA